MNSSLGHENGEISPPPRRRYDSPLRRDQTAQTRQRLIVAASEVVHSFTTWDWKELTFRAVAERAEVSERTVYRHFGTERELHDAVMAHIRQQSGVSYEGLELEGITDVAVRTLSALSSFAVSSWPDRHPAQQLTLATEDQLRRDALTRAVDAAAADWTERERHMAAALLDVLWNVPSFERMKTVWNVDADQAMVTLSWVIDLVVEAIRHDRRPGSDPKPRL